MYHVDLSLYIMKIKCDTTLAKWHVVNLLMIRMSVDRFSLFKSVIPRRACKRMRSVRLGLDPSPLRPQLDSLLPLGGGVKSIALGRRRQHKASTRHRLAVHLPEVPVSIISLRG